MAIDRNVYILGAGFSKNAGVPLMKEFMQQARWLFYKPDSPLSEEEKKRFANVFDYLQKLSSASAKCNIDIENIEHIFSLLEIDLLHEGGSLEDVYNDFLYLISRTIEASLSEPYGQTFYLHHERTGDEVEVIKSMLDNGSLTQSKYLWEDRPSHLMIRVYDYFALIIAGTLIGDRNTSDAVITFNYDLVLDRALQRCGFKISYFEPPTGAFGLYKLHGSINWGYCTKCQDLVLTDFEPVYKSACPKCNSNLRPLLIPPSWDKGVREKQIQEVWRQALDMLRTAKRIYIIGYSFPETDQYFRYLLYVGLKENEYLEKIMIINPDLPSKPDMDEPVWGESPRSNYMELAYGAMFQKYYADRRLVFSGSTFAGFLAHRWAEIDRFQER